MPLASLNPFDISDFPRLWDCGDGWTSFPGWGWVHVVADIATWGAFLTIPIVLWYFVRRRHDLPFHKILWLFGAFIFCCGTVHLVEAMLFWWPAYRLSGYLKLATAAVSWATVAALIPVVPRALSFRSPNTLEETIRERTSALRALTDKLRESEERLRLSLQAGRMGTWDWNLSTNYFTADEVEMALLAINSPDGRADIELFFDRVHPEDREATRSVVEACVRDQVPYEHEFRIVDPMDQSVRWLMARGRVFYDDQQRPLRLVGVNVDITEERTREEMTRVHERAISATRHGIVIVDALHPDQPLIYANPAFEKLTGYTAAEAIGRNCRFLQGPRTRRSTVEALRRAIAAKEECHVTILNYRADGEPFFNELHISPVEDSDGRVTHFVGIQVDATERLRSEQQLREARRTAESASQAKSEFLANMSHEIRTPLTAILGCADTLQPQLKDPGAAEMVQVIRNQGQLLLGILNDVLDLSKIEAGRLELRTETASVVSLMNEVQALMQPVAASKGIALTTRYETGIPDTITTDPLRVRQILLNLVSNAIKFTSVGSVRLVVRSVPTDEGLNLRVAVEDTGMGISREQLEVVFEAFRQGDAGIARRVGGTGLGLTISQRLASMLGGCLEVSSELGRGSVFTLVIPTGRPANVPLQQPEEIANREKSAVQRMKDSVELLIPSRVLIAEDTAAIRFLMQRMLSDLVSEIVFAADGREAVEDVRRAEREGKPFHLILMDMQMPVMDGFTATATLREEGCRTPIIALTAGAMAVDREKCLRMGCDDYVSKPIDQQKLLAVLVRQYNRHEPGKSKRGSD